MLLKKKKQKQKGKLFKLKFQLKMAFRTIQAAGIIWFKQK